MTKKCTIAHSSTISIIPAHELQLCELCLQECHAFSSLPEVYCINAQETKGKLT